MGRLDEIKNRGFNSDVEIDYVIGSYDWDLSKFTRALPRNYIQIKQLLDSEAGCVPFINFNAWIQLKKGVNVGSYDKDYLDVCFEEYKNFYLYMINHNRLRPEYSEYRLEDNFEDELIMFTKQGRDCKVIDHSKSISIGDIETVRVDLSMNVVVDRARRILESGGGIK